MLATWHLLIGTCSDATASGDDDFDAAEGAVPIRDRVAAGLRGLETVCAVPGLVACLRRHLGTGAA
jgi:hypothetical protein